MFLFVFTVIQFAVGFKEVSINDATLNEWSIVIIGNIKYAKMTESGEAIINSDKNVLIKYDILGNRKWISPSLSGDLIKI